MKVVLPASVDAELREIEAYIARDDPAAARRTTDGLIETCLSLEPAPERGPLVGKTLHRRKIRRLVHTPYLIFYAIDADVIRILRIVHGARAPRSLLKDLDLP